MIEMKLSWVEMKGIRCYLGLMLICLACRGSYDPARRSGGARAADAVLATAVLGPVGLLAGASRKGAKGTAFVIFANGSVHESHPQDAQALVKAQADALRFNALAVAAEPAPAPAATATTQVMVCLDCINRGCDKVLGGEVGWTRLASSCVCQAHHPAE